MEKLLNANQLDGKVKYYSVLFCSVPRIWEKPWTVARIAGKSTLRCWKKELFINKYVATLSCTFMSCFFFFWMTLLFPKEYGEM